VLRRIFGPKREEVTVGWRKIRDEGLCNLYRSPNIITVVRTRTKRWVGHVVQMGKMRRVK